MNDKDRKTLETWRDVIDAFLAGKEVEYEHGGAWLRFAPGALALLLRHWTTENDVLGDGRPRTPARVRVKPEPKEVYMVSASDKVFHSRTAVERYADSFVRAGHERPAIMRFVEDLNSEKTS